MKRALFLGSAAIAISGIAAPVMALDVDFSGYTRFNASGGEVFESSSTTGVRLNALGHKVFDDGENPNNTANDRIAPSSTGVVDKDLSFDNAERLNVSINETTCCFNYGGVVRINDASSMSMSSDIYLSGDWGRLDYGNLDNARVGAYDFSVIDAGPLLVSNTPMFATDANDFKFDGTSVGGTNIVYTAPGTLFGGFGFKASTDGDKAEVGVTNSFDLPGLGSLGVRATVADNSAYGVMVTGNAVGLKFAGWTGEDDDNDDYHGGALAKSFGAIDASVSYMNAKGRSATGFVSEQTVIGGLGYKIATGLTAKAAVRNRDHSAFGDATDYSARLQLDF